MASGVNDSRPKLLSLLRGTSITLLVVEHRDWLTRFGFHSIETLFETQGRKIEVVNAVENNNEDLIADLVAIVSRFTARLYGQRRAKRKTERIVAELQEQDKQHFVQLPHARFVDMLCYKARLVGIQVVLQEESYTSKASFLDGDAIPTYGEVEQEPRFSGRRVKRGLYRASGKRFLNADVNGSYNILRKASPDAFGKGVEAVAVQPGRLTVRTGGHLS